MVWKRKRITEDKILAYLNEKYPNAEIHLHEYKKLAKYEPLLQKDYGLAGDCTLTAITTILSADLKMDVQQVYDVVEKWAKKHFYIGKGTYPIFIKRIINKAYEELSGEKLNSQSGYLKSLGYDIADIQMLIDCGRPVVLSIFKDGRNYYDNHSITVIGYALYSVDGVLTPMLLVYDNWKKCVSAVDYKALCTISSINYY